MAAKSNGNERINFVRVDCDPKAQGRKLRYKHKDLRDVVKDTDRNIGQLFNDPFNGWPYLLLYGLRWQDLQLTLDKCSEMIDYWTEQHIEEKAPLEGLGIKIMEALNLSGFVNIRPEGSLDEPGGLEGNAPVPDDSIR